VSHLLLNSHYVHRIGEVLLQRYFTKPERFKKILASAYGQTPEEEALNGYLKPLTVKDTAKGILVMSAQNSNFQIDYSKIWNKMFLIWGEKDTWIPIQTAKKFQEKYTDIPLKIIPETGHCPMETHSKEFNSLVVELMNKR
jgi:pimeloyl-ACP methyl ester carboxylesterase